MNFQETFNSLQQMFHTIKWKKRVSLRAISRETGLHPLTLSRFYNSEINPEYKTLAKITEWIEANKQYLE